VSLPCCLQVAREIQMEQEKVVAEAEQALEAAKQRAVDDIRDSMRSVNTPQPGLHRACLSCLSAAGMARPLTGHRSKHEARMEALAQQALADSERVLLEEKADLEAQVLEEQSRAINEVKAALQQGRHSMLQQVGTRAGRLPLAHVGRDDVIALGTRMVVVADRSSARCYTTGRPR
jgi:hypothetical protein